MDVSAPPKIIDAIHEDSMENLGHNATLGLVSHEKTAKTVGGGLAGAAAGAPVAFSRGFTPVVTGPRGAAGPLERRPCRINDRGVLGAG